MITSQYFEKNLTWLWGVGWLEDKKKCKLEVRTGTKAELSWRWKTMACLKRCFKAKNARSWWWLDALKMTVGWENGHVLGYLGRKTELWWRMTLNPGNLPKSCSLQIFSHDPFSADDISRAIFPAMGMIKHVYFPRTTLDSEVLPVGKYKFPMKTIKGAKEECCQRGSFEPPWWFHSGDCFFLTN